MVKEKHIRANIFVLVILHHPGLRIHLFGYEYIIHDMFKSVSVVGGRLYSVPKTRVISKSMHKIVLKPEAQKLYLIEIFQQIALIPQTDEPEGKKSCIYSVRSVYESRTYKNDFTNRLKYIPHCKASASSINFVANWHITSYLSRNICYIMTF